MRAEFTSEARKDLESFGEEQLRAIRQRVEELEDDPTGHDSSKIIQVAGRSLYRARVREERGGEIDHRIIYDVRDGRIVIYSVIERDSGYDEEELEKRL